VSFARLLDEICQCPEALTAATVLPAGSKVDRVSWEQEFARGLLGGHVDTDKVAAHLPTLRATVDPIKRYVDTQVAHLDQQPTKDDPTYDDLNTAIDYLGSLSQECTALLHFADRWLLPIDLGDIMAPFRVAWLPEKPRQPRRRAATGGSTPPFI
jgi:hypothetical protein